ncbi:MAG: lactonase family protein [Faecousia sp.]
MKKQYAFVGSWSFQPGEKGISIYAFAPETGALQFLCRLHPEISVGNQYLDQEKGLLYITDESGSVRNGTVGGGVHVFRIGGESVLADFACVDTLLPKPSYFAIDQGGKYALVSHHSNRGCVTKLVKKDDGTFASETVTDDAGLVLFRRNGDGSLGEICDVVLTPGREPYGTHPFSHEHCVNADRSGRLYLVCDKGQDLIYSFRLDRERGRLIRIHTTQVPENFAPRYVAFHPTRNFVYENNEKQPILLAFHYDPETGGLDQMDSLNLLDNGEPGDCADLRMHPSGKVLYASVRGANRICVVALDEDGKMRKKQTLACDGENPRGLCLSPDGRFLLCANLGSDSISVFPVAQDGSLYAPVQQARGHLPGNITIAEVNV